MTLSNFDDLLRAARSQAQPQRLLFVFAGAALPDDSTQEQAIRFANGEGGTLLPLMAVDKAPDELVDFPTLVEESLQFGPTWQILFAAAIAGRNGSAPSAAQVEPALQEMVESIRHDRHGAWMPFDRQGDLVVFG